MSIRKAIQNDLSVIVEMLANDKLGKTREDFKVPLPDHYIIAFEEIQADKNQELYVFENQNKEIIGTFQLSFLQYLTYKGGIRAQIEAVRIREDQRGKGIGEQMIKSAIERANERKAHVIQLTTDKKRDAALKFYEKLGFTSSHEGMKLHLFSIMLFLGLLFPGLALGQTEACKKMLHQATNHYVIKNYKEAAQEYSKVIETCDYIPAYFGRGVCYFLMDDFEKALNDFMNPDVNEIYKQDTMYLWFVGKTHHNLDGFSEAYPYYKAAEKNGMSIDNELGLDLGTVCYFLGKNEDALKYLQNFTYHNQLTPGAYTNLGWIFLEANNYPKALKNFKRLLNFRP